MKRALSQSHCCRSISCWALSRYAQWIVERCSDPQQDVNAAQAQLEEVLQVSRQHHICFICLEVSLICIDDNSNALQAHYKTRRWGKHFHMYGNKLVGNPYELLGTYVLGCFPHCLFCNEPALHCCLHLELQCLP